MKKLIWITSILILFTVFVFPGLMALFLDMIPASDQPGYDEAIMVSIYGKRTFKQEFVSKESNLVAVATSIRNFNLKNEKDIILDLFDQEGNLIRTSVLNGKNIEDGDFVKFVFDVVPDSKDKKYSFELSSPTAGQGEVINVFIIEPTDTVLSYVYDKEEDDEVHPGGVPMVTFHKPNSKLEIVKGVYSNWLSKLLH